MEIKRLKKYITNKFGSTSRFARVIGRDPVEFHNSLKGDAAYLEDIAKLAKSTKNSVLTDRELTVELRKKIRVTIYTEYKNLTEFSKANPEYSLAWLSNVINGKTGGYYTERKLISKKIRTLCKTLKIEI